MLVARRETENLASRPLRDLVDLWLIVVAYVSVKGLPGGVGTRGPAAFAAVAAALAVIWWIGRQRWGGRICSVLLADGDPAAPQQQPSRAPHAGAIWPKTAGRFGMFRKPGWWLAGLVVMASLLVLLEKRQPYYFVQDDNLAQFLPVVLDGCHSLIEDGVFPTWNPHQYLGSPTSSLGTYALTYPPTYASYVVARYLLRDEYATLDVFCIVHLLFGYASAYWACRVFGIRASLSAAASLCFALSGFFLIAGRSWYYMTPTAAWMPVLWGLLERFRRGPVGWKWVLGVGAVLGALFHAGNAQMWCYAVLLYTVAVGIFVLCRAVAWRQLVPALAALATGIAIALPLLLPQYLETAKVHHPGSDGTHQRCLPMHCIFAPFPIARADFYGVAQTPDRERAGEIMYSGTVFSLAAAVGMLSLVVHRWRRETVAANVWCILAWIALVMALGRIGGLWYLLSKVPPFARFTHSFKLIPFATLFMAVGGALVLERALRHWGARLRWELGIFTTAAVLIGYHASIATPSFCDYSFRPYPELTPEIRALGQDQPPQRIYSIGPRRSLAPEYSASLMHHWPTIYEMYAFDGYDPLVSGAPRFTAVTDRLLASPSVMHHWPAICGMYALDGYDPLVSGAPRFTAVTDWLPASTAASSQQPQSGETLPQALETLRAYGVRWVSVYTGPQDPVVPMGGKNEYFWNTDFVLEQLSQEVRAHGRVVVNRPEVCIYDLADAAPLAFAARQPQQSLPIQFNAAGLTIDTSGLAEGDDVVVNVLHAPFLKASAEGKALTIGADKWNRLVLHVPPGARQIDVCYSPPWLLGTMLGAGLMLAVVVVMRQHGSPDVVATERAHAMTLPQASASRRAA